LKTQYYLKINNIPQIQHPHQFVCGIAEAESMRLAGILNDRLPRFAIDFKFCTSGLFTNVKARAQASLHSRIRGRFRNISGCVFADFEVLKLAGHSLTGS
jgi:hypothetical protein